MVDEFFGGWGTAIGGYGALARKYICRYIPCGDIQIDLLLDTQGGLRTRQTLIDRTMIYRLPRHPRERQRWLDGQGYNLFLSIEMTEPSFQILRDLSINTPLLFWIQDPRELHMYHARRETVNRLKDEDWNYIGDVAVWLQEWIKRDQVKFVSQGHSLSKIARKAYHIPEAVPIMDLPNPVELDLDYKLNEPPKGNKVIFLGRLEAQKRAWIVCEIAKRMPHISFFILGATGVGRNEAANARTLEPYRHPNGKSKIRNLHFTGHLDGEEKNQHLKTAKLLLNTSIWEGIPVSWLEALSYGTIIVSAFDRDELVGRFGTFVGEVMGDGTEEADLKKFMAAIDYWMTHDAERALVAQKAIEFVRGRHSVPVFIDSLRGVIRNSIR